MYKFSLDKTSKKFICPRCGKKRFVRYVDSENKGYLEGNYGKCDRETSCKFHESPKQAYQSTLVPVQEIKREKSTIKYCAVIKSGTNYKSNNFIQFLRIYFSDEELKAAIKKYLIGTSNHWKGATVFWQINQNQEILTGKVMLYDLTTAKRVKKPYNHITWIHKTLQIPNFELQQCLFGLHLINEFPTRTIALVEAEKTAIVMSLFLPDYLWLATGSKANFKKELLGPIKKFNIIAFPDKSEYEDWHKKSKQLQLDGFTIQCSDYVEKKNVLEGTDLADLYFDSKKPKVIEIKYTKTEIEVNRLAKINPQILNLIKTFELLDDNDNEIVNVG